MNRTIIMGSPRVEGRSAHLAQRIFDAYIEDCPDDGVSMVSLVGMSVAPCMGCDACRGCTEASDADAQDQDNTNGDLSDMVAVVAASDARLHRCVIDDDMLYVRRLLDATDELIMVSPLYFASAPAQFKALMDRLQPYFWSDIRESDIRRPMELHIVGEGGNPYGYDALVTTVRSAFGAVGFRLTRLLDWVGRIDAAGDIADDAEETLFEDALQ